MGVQPAYLRPNAISTNSKLLNAIAKCEQRPSLHAIQSCNLITRTCSNRSLPRSRSDIRRICAITCVIHIMFTRKPTVNHRDCISRRYRVATSAYLLLSIMATACSDRKPGMSDLFFNPVIPVLMAPDPDIIGLKNRPLNVYWAIKQNRKSAFRSQHLQNETACSLYTYLSDRHSIDTRLHNLHNISQFYSFDIMALSW